MAMRIGVFLGLGWTAAYLAIGHGYSLGWPLLAVVVGVLALVFPVNYRLTETELVVRSGLLRWRIPFDAIQEVHPTSNPLSSPAWSLDRLHVSYRSKGGEVHFLLISPENKRIFLRDLAGRASELEFDEDSVKRTGGTGWLTGER